ncbi:MAG: uroporphyrinogen decarboxylase family protein [Chloroflexota bacterium]
MVTHRQRLETCLSGASPDRVPVALWRHFPVDDQTPESLAHAALVFQRTFEFDLVKVTPASSYCLKDWGVRDEWHGATEGTRQYTQRVIQNPEDWKRLPALDPHQGYLAAQLRCLRLLLDELGSETPVIQTIFNPLSQAKNLVGGDALLVHMRRFPDALQAGLATISESTRRFVEALLDTGVAGIFYAIQHAKFGLLSPEEYLRFGKPYDLQILEPVRQLWLNMLHLHGEEVMFDLVADYPVNILNWHDRDTAPSLAQGQMRFPGVVCGGLQRERTMVLGTPQMVRQEAMEAIQATSGQRFILGTGCVIPIHTPYGNLLAARQSVE